MGGTDKVTRHQRPSLETGLLINFVPKA